MLEALSREFRTGYPWELLYAEDLMISAKPMEELLVKVKIWKTEMEKKGLCVNMGKTKIMESGINQDVLKKSGKYLSVCLTGVGSTNSILYGGCERWVHKKCSGIKGRLLPDSKFRCARCLGTASAIDERQSLEVAVGNEKLEACPRVVLPWGHALCRKWLRAGCHHTLKMYMGQVPAIASPSHQPPSAHSDQR